MNENNPQETEPSPSQPGEVPSVTPTPPVWHHPLTCPTPLSRVLTLALLLVLPFLGFWMGVEYSQSLTTHEDGTGGDVREKREEREPQEQVPLATDTIPDSSSELIVTVTGIDYITISMHIQGATVTPAQATEFFAEKLPGERTTYLDTYSYSHESSDTLVYNHQNGVVSISKYMDDIDTRQPVLKNVATVVPVFIRTPLGRVLMIVAYAQGRSNTSGYHGAHPLSVLEIYELDTNTQRLALLHRVIESPADVASSQGADPASSAVTLSYHVSAGGLRVWSQKEVVSGDESVGIVTDTQSYCLQEDADYYLPCDDIKREVSRSLTNDYISVPVTEEEQPLTPPREVPDGYAVVADAGAGISIVYPVEYRMVERHEPGIFRTILSRTKYGAERGQPIDCGGKILQPDEISLSIMMYATEPPFVSREYDSLEEVTLGNHSFRVRRNVGSMCENYDSYLSRLKDGRTLVVYLSPSETEYFDEGEAIIASIVTDGF